MGTRRGTASCSGLQFWSDSLALQLSRVFVVDLLSASLSFTFFSLRHSLLWDACENSVRALPCSVFVCAVKFVDLSGDLGRFALPLVHGTCLRVCFDWAVYLRGELCFGIVCCCFLSLFWLLDSGGPPPLGHERKVEGQHSGRDDPDRLSNNTF